MIIWVSFTVKLELSVYNIALVQTNLLQLIIKAQ